jgi:hypothetical protein
MSNDCSQNPIRYFIKEHLWDSGLSYETIKPVLDSLFDNPDLFFDRSLSRIPLDKSLKSNLEYNNLQYNIATCLLVRPVFPHFDLIRAVLNWLLTKKIDRYAGLLFRTDRPILFIRNQTASSDTILCFDISHFNNIDWVEFLETRKGTTDSVDQSEYKLYLVGAFTVICVGYLIKCIIY